MIKQPQQNIIGILLYTCIKCNKFAAIYLH